jgi:hypothetical protein
MRGSTNDRQPSQKGLAARLHQVESQKRKTWPPVPTKDQEGSNRNGSDRIMWAPEQQAMYYGGVLEELAEYCDAVEERREYLEAMTNSATGLLRRVIKDFQSPYLEPIMGLLMERLNSIAAFMETGIDSIPNPNKYNCTRTYFDQTVSH